MSEKKQGQQRPGSAEDGSNNRLLQSMPRETVYGVRRRYPGTIEWELLKYFNPNKEEEEDFYDDEPLEEEIIDEGSIRWNEYVSEMMKEENEPEEYKSPRHVDPDELTELIANAEAVRNERLDLQSLADDPLAGPGGFCLGFTKREIYEDKFAGTAEMDLADEQIFDSIAEEINR